MRKSSASLFIVLAIIAAILIFFFVKFGLSMNTISEVAVERSNLEDAISTLKNEDYVIYWIGNVPSHISSAGLNIVTVNTSDINEATLPTKTISTPFYVTDKDGNVLESSDKRVYPKNVFVVVNNVQGLTDNQLSIINECAVSNNAIIYVIGENPVRLYRELLFMPNGENDHYCSMRFSVRLGSSMDIINEEYVTNFSSYDAEFSVQIVNVMLSDIVKTDNTVVETTLCPMPETTVEITAEITAESAELPELSGEPSYAEATLG